MSVQKKQKTDKQEQASRRDFLRRSGTLIGVGLCSGTLAAIIQSCDDEAGPAYPAPGTISGNFVLDVNNEPDLQTPGGNIRRRFGSFYDGQPVIIVRRDATSFLALSAICTHEVCVVDPPRPGDGIIVCPCHEAEFSSADGSVLRGPAKQGLYIFDTNFDAESGMLTVGRVEG